MFGLLCSKIIWRVLCSRKKKDPLQQTDPPSIPIDELFPSGDFPEGEIQEYKDE
jgi:methionyl aminopeptidase